MEGRDILTGVRSTEAGWTDNEIRHDGLASRAEVVDSTGTTRYAWDGIRVLKIEDEEGTLKQRQVHGHSAIPSVGGMTLIESAAGDPYAPVADQVGTVVKVLGSAAAGRSSSAACWRASGGYVRGSTRPAGVSPRRPG